MVSFSLLIDNRYREHFTSIERIHVDEEYDDFVERTYSFESGRNSSTTLDKNIHQAKQFLGSHQAEVLNDTQIGKLTLFYLLPVNIEGQTLLDELTQSNTDYVGSENIVLCPSSFCSLVLFSSELWPDFGHSKQKQTTRRTHNKKRLFADGAKKTIGVCFDVPYVGDLFGEVVLASDLLTGSFWNKTHELAIDKLMKSSLAVENALKPNIAKWLVKRYY